jgi:AcrR family transcriptional regulator
VSVNDIVREAGVAKGTFYVHFPDRSALLVAVHQRFHEQIGMAIGEAVREFDPGVQRLLAAANAYLDACIALVGTKAMLLEARADLAVSADAAARERTLAKQAARSFEAVGITHAPEAARLYVALVAETALVELEYGQRVPTMREELARWITAAGHDSRDHRDSRPPARDAAI